LRSGDLCVQGSESFADYRKQLLPWEECLQRLPAYCEKVGLPTRGRLRKRKIKHAKPVAAAVAA
ncbi:hypothetical protein FLI61_32375, partial [Pseudomonas aeruginosa]